MANSDVKTWLDHWCFDRKIFAHYSVKQIGPNYGSNEVMRYQAEVNVDTYSYVGVGKFFNKKGAENNAAMDFVQFLIHRGILLASDCQALQSPSIYRGRQQPQLDPGFLDQAPQSSCAGAAPRLKDVREFNMALQRKTEEEAMAESNPKTWLLNYCIRWNLRPPYVKTKRDSAKFRRHAMKYISIVRVDTFSYEAMAKAIGRREASIKAAKDFIRHYIEEGVIHPSECPNIDFDNRNTQVKKRKDPKANQQSLLGPVPQTSLLGPVPVGLPTVGNMFEPFVREARPMPFVNQMEGFSSFHQESLLGAAPIFQPSLSTYRPMFRDGRTMPYVECPDDQRALEKAEDMDSTAELHGNWTTENAKYRLHIYLDASKSRADYHFKQIGPDHDKYFSAEMTFFVKEAQKSIHGRELGPTKHVASNRCALSLIRQLYHLNVIEDYATTEKKEETKAVVNSYEVAVSPELASQIDSILNYYNIKPFSIVENESVENMILDIDLDKSEVASTSSCNGTVVPWSPPQQKWNPLIAGNIDEDTLARISLEDVSRELHSTMQYRSQSDLGLQKSMQERYQLPITAKRETILNAIIENSVVIVRGNTGCGKSTQVCQYILDDYIQIGFGAYCNIVITQPRRISALSLSDRVASERCENMGQSIGYSVRFKSQLPRPYGGILFCTLDVLLKKLEAGLHGVSHIIVDEIHERDIYSDYILNILRDMVRAFPDLRIILMSATMDISLFANYFSKPVVIELEARSFPVDQYFLEDFIELSHFKPSSGIRKRKMDTDEDLPVDDPEENLNVFQDKRYSQVTLEAMQQISETDISFEVIEAILKHITTLNIEGAILIFLPGLNIIVALIDFLKRHPDFGNGSYTVLPLHSQLTLEDQRKVFEPVSVGVRKIVLATNIAETSFTISDVVFIIDSCRMKTKVFKPNSKMTKYTTVWASRSNLEQRKGRAGRVRRGMCFRMCSRKRYEKLDLHTAPEVLRVPLHEIALSIKLLNLGSISEFLSKAIDAPPAEAVKEAEATLREMKCLDNNDELTPLGRILARLPIESHLGSMVVMGCMFFCGDAMCTIAAFNTISSEIFIIPQGYKALSRSQKAFAGNHRSDHLAVVNVFSAWEKARMGGEEAEIRFCTDNWLSMPTLRVVWEAKNQLKELFLNAGFSNECLMSQSYNYNGPDKQLDTIAALLTAGHYPNICYHKERLKVVTQEEKIAFIHWSSINCGKGIGKFPTPFFVYGEEKGTKRAACKHMTMVAPIHLLLLGCHTVQYVDEVVLLDGWLKLKMEPQIASKIVALRPVLKALLVRAANEPGSLTLASHTNNMIAVCLQSLFDINAGRFNMEPLLQTGGSHNSNIPRPPKHSEGSLPMKIRGSIDEACADEELQQFCGRDSHSPMMDVSPPDSPKDSYPPWWTPACTEAVRSKKNASRRYQRSSRRNDFISYRKQCTITRSVLRLARKNAATPQESASFSNTSPPPSPPTIADP